MTTLGDWEALNHFSSVDAMKEAVEYVKKTEEINNFPGLYGHSYREGYLGLGRKIEHATGDVRDAMFRVLYDLRVLDQVILAVDTEQ